MRGLELTRLEQESSCQWNSILIHNNRLFFILCTSYFTLVTLMEAWGILLCENDCLSQVIDVNRNILFRYIAYFYL